MRTSSDGTGQQRLWKDTSTAHISKLKYSQRTCSCSRSHCCSCAPTAELAHGPGTIPGESPGGLFSARRGLFYTGWMKVSTVRAEALFRAQRLCWGCFGHRYAHTPAPRPRRLRRCHRGGAAAADHRLRCGGALRTRGAPGPARRRQTRPVAGGGGAEGAPQPLRGGDRSPPPSHLPPLPAGRGSWRAANFTAPVPHRTAPRRAGGDAGGSSGGSGGGGGGPCWHSNPSAGRGGSRSVPRCRVSAGGRGAGRGQSRSAALRPHPRCSAAPRGSRCAPGRLGRGTAWARRSPTPRGKAAPRRPAPGGTTARTTCCWTRSRAKRAPCRPTPSTPCKCRRPGPRVSACAGAERAGAQGSALAPAGGRGRGGGGAGAGGRGPAAWGCAPAGAEPVEGPARGWPRWGLGQRSSPSPGGLCLWQREEQRWHPRAQLAEVSFPGAGPCPAAGEAKNSFGLPRRVMREPPLVLKADGTGCV